ncbi:hypothetical protein SAMN05444372_10987 [Flavobacterium micromati]|uniref:Uncharacterized protein n=1 Tax=Flavobacterium micromati TaxID=229205 RepID=A0A1M5M9E6_9FLAO|nr:hypothetical protein SAMN05444372_10987 [Flavobacterium micromati]
MNIQQTTEQKELCKLINKLEQKTGNTNLLLILKAVHTLSVDNETNLILTFLKQNYSYCME